MRGEAVASVQVLHQFMTLFPLAASSSSFDPLVCSMHLSGRLLGGVRYAVSVRTYSHKRKIDSACCDVDGKASATDGVQQHQDTALEYVCSSHVAPVMTLIVVEINGYLRQHR